MSLSPDPRFAATSYGSNNDDDDDDAHGDVYNDDKTDVDAKRRVGNVGKSINHNEDDGHYSSVPLLDITQKIKTWDTPSRLPGPIRRLMSVGAASVEDAAAAAAASADDATDSAATAASTADNNVVDVDNLGVPDDVVVDDDAFGGRATPLVEMDVEFDPREIEEDEMIETVNIWDMPIFQVAEKHGNSILSRVSVQCIFFVVVTHT